MPTPPQAPVPPDDSPPYPCPACAEPIPQGTSKCPWCATYLGPTQLVPATESLPAPPRADRKNPAVSFGLALVFGPLGLMYSSPKLGVLMLLPIIAFMVALGIGPLEAMLLTLPWNLVCAVSALIIGLRKETGRA